ncbi:hypothetical protein MTO96_014963 [Rhipicephalus appendiculatus]
MAMYLGCSTVLTIVTALCRTVEIYIMTLTPYDTTECCWVSLKGSFHNPEYSANTVSRYVGFAIMNFLSAAFKAVIMVRLFEMYDDISETIENDTTPSKLRSKLLY